VLSGVVRAKGPVLPPCCDVLWCGKAKAINLPFIGDGIYYIIQ
jgi:hypothetical protein